MSNSLFPGLFYRREIVSADRFRSPVAGDQGYKIRPQPMGGPYGWGKFDDGKNMGAAFARIQSEFFRCRIDPAYLNIDPAYKDPFAFIRDGQNCLSAAFDLRGIIDLSEIQNVRFCFQPGLRSLGRFK